MYNFRFRKEKFGFIVSFPNGEVKLIDKSAGKLIKEKKIDLLSQHEISLEEVNLKNYLPLSAPICVSVELTRKCNLECNHCYLNAGKPRQKELITREIKTLLLHLKKMGVFLVFITGGEPTLRKDFKEIINFLFKIDLDFNIVTNGTLLNKNFLEKLNHKTPFIVSFEGIKNHNKIRKGFERYGDIREKLLLLKSLRFPFLTQYTLQRDNFEDLIETYKWCEENEIILTAMDLVCAERAKENKEILPLEKDLVRNKKLMEAKINYEIKRINFKNNSYDVQDKIANPYYYSFISALVEKTHQNYPGVFDAYIASDGKVYPDTYYAESEKYSESSILERPFKKNLEN